MNGMSAAHRTPATERTGIAQAALTIRRRLSVLAFAVLAGGCSVLPSPRADEPVLHVLDARPAPEAAAERRNVVLEVATPRGAPGFDTAGIAYVRKPYTVDYFATHRWADTPALMLMPLLIRTLDATGGYAAVVRTPAALSADLRLDTDLVRLAQDFTSAPSRVELVLRVQLVNVRERRVIATRTIEVAQPAPSEDPEGGVVAANAAVAQALAEVARFVDATFARSSPAR